VIAGPGAIVNIGGDSTTHSVPVGFTVLQVTDITTNEDDVWSAIDLYAERLPLEERYDDDAFIDLIRRHLSGDFGPRRVAAHWTPYLLIAKNGPDVVGMLLGYNFNDMKSNFLYIPYLIAQEPQPNHSNPRDISRMLVRELARLQLSRDNKGLQVRFLAEVDDPAETEDPSERLTRRARIRLFNRIAGFANMQLRCVDLKFLQPKLNLWNDLPEQKLLLCYGAEHPQRVLFKAELLEITIWFYKQLYAANMFDDPNEDREYQHYLDRLLKSASETIPDSVQLFRLEEYDYVLNR
jgi:hypothetical protein